MSAEQVLRGEPDIEAADNMWRACEHPTAEGVWIIKRSPKPGGAWKTSTRHAGAEECLEAWNGVRAAAGLGPVAACAHMDANGRCADPSAVREGHMCFGCENRAEPSRTGAHAPAKAAEDARIAPEEVTTAYFTACCGVIAVVRFGAMLAAISTVLTRENGAKTTDPGYTGGLQAWLALNCPDVNYKTAARMKGTGEAVCAALNADPALMSRALCPDPKTIADEPDAEALAALRDRVAGIIAGRSERSLVLWLKGGAPATPAGREDDIGQADAHALDAARRFAKAAADALKCLDARQRQVVGSDVARALREALGLKGLAWLARVLQEAEENGE